MHFLIILILCRIEVEAKAAPPYQLPNYYDQWEYDAWAPNQVSYPEYNENTNKYIDYESNLNCPYACTTECSGEAYPDYCPYECTIECDSDDPITVPPDPVTVPPVKPKCPYHVPGWNNIGNRHIYLGQVENGLSWYASDAKSLEVGGHLLKVKSVEDNQLFKAIKDCYPSGTKLWIGGQDLAKSNQWAWSTGELIKGYFNFDPSTNSESGLHCLDIILPNDLTWKKSNCNGADSIHGFIAEKVEAPPTTTTTSTTTSTTTTTTTPAPTTRTSITTVSSTKPTPRPTMYPTTQGGGGPPTPPPIASATVSSTTRR